MCVCVTPKASQVTWICIIEQISKVEFHPVAKKKVILRMDETLNLSPSLKRGRRKKNHFTTTD